jgi:hypothetical protein
LITLKDANDYLGIAPKKTFEYDFMKKCIDPRFWILLLAAGQLAWRRC